MELMRLTEGDPPEYIINIGLDQKISKFRIFLWIFNLIDIREVFGLEFLFNEIFHLKINSG